MSRSHYSHSNDIGEALGEGMVMLGIALLLLCIYLSVQAILLIYRGFAAQPNNKVLWALAGATILFGLIAFLTKGERLAVGLCGLCFIALLIACRIVELNASTLFLKQGGPLLSNVLNIKKGSWWQQPQKALAPTK